MNPDFRDILSALSAEGADYLVVGAYALAVHGLPRATGDLDIWVSTGPGNAERVRAALARFGAPLDQFPLADLSRPDMVFQIGVAPQRVDLLTSIDGVDFQAAWKDRHTADVEALHFPVISRRHLAQNKRAVGRPQDLADLAWLEGSEPPP